MTSAGLRRPGDESRDPFRFDHGVVVVPTLEEAARRWHEAGFRVVEGGRHRGSPTANLLVPFPDGSYLELLAANRALLPPVLGGLRHTPLWPLAKVGRGPLARRFLEHLARGTGLADFALAVSDVAAAVKAAGERGLELAGPEEMGRARPDGVELRWRMAVPATRDLPFLIQDLTPREQRVPAADPTHGFAGIDGVRVRTADLGDSIRRYRALLGRGEERLEAGERGARFRVSGVWIHLLPPEKKKPEGAEVAVLRAGELAPEGPLAEWLESVPG